MMVVLEVVYISFTSKLDLPMAEVMIVMRCAASRGLKLNVDCLQGR
jgi:hypothetical protein